MRERTGLDVDPPTMEIRRPVLGQNHGFRGMKEAEDQEVLIPPTVPTFDPLAVANGIRQAQAEVQAFTTQEVKVDTIPTYLPPSEQPEAPSPEPPLTTPSGATVKMLGDFGGEALWDPVVRVIAYTKVIPENMTDATEGQWVPDVSQESDGDLLTEFAGRGCYQSWSKPNPKTAENVDYIANIIRQEHYSVLEHSTATFHISGVSRSLMAELTRHRHLSFSNLSQRYVDAKDSSWVIPPLYAADPEANAAELDIIDNVMWFTKTAYERLVWSKMKQGIPSKQAREAARCVMPNAVETEITVTGNLLAWRQVLEKRYSPAADREILRLMPLILDHLAALYPNNFRDLLTRFRGRDQGGYEEGQ